MSIPSRGEIWEVKPEFKNVYIQQLQIKEVAGDYTQAVALTGQHAGETVRPSVEHLRRVYRPVDVFAAQHPPVARGQFWHDETVEVDVLSVLNNVVTWAGDDGYGAAPEKDFLARFTRGPLPIPEPFALTREQTHSFAVTADETMDEVVRQIEKWGEQHHPSTRDDAFFTTARVRHGVIHEPVAKAECQRQAAKGTVTWADILTEEVAEAYAAKNDDDLITELTQIAAVAWSWIVDIRSRA